MFKKKPIQKVFGVPLAEAVLANRSATQHAVVADVVCDVIVYLEKHEFLAMEGIYRVPGRQSRLEALRDAYDRGKPVDFEGKMEDPFTYLRSLPEPLLPQPMAAEMEAAADNLSLIRSIFARLPPPNRALLSMVARHAANVAAAEATNKMGLKNVIIVFVPSLYCSPKVFSVLVSNAVELFAQTCSVCGGTISDDSCPQCDGSTDGMRKSGSGRGNKLFLGRTSRNSVSGPAGGSGGGSGSKKSAAAPVVVGGGVGGGGPPSPRSSPHAAPQLPRGSPRNVSSSAVPTLSPRAPEKSPRGAGGGSSPRSSPSPPDFGPPGNGTVFGSSLVKTCRLQGGSVVLPSFVRQCWKFVDAHAASAKGVYVTPPVSSSLLDGLQAKFDGGARINLAEELFGVPDAPLVAGALFKRYMWQLSAPVWSVELLSSFERHASSPPDLAPLVFSLTLEERTFLLHFVAHIRSVVKAEAALPGPLLAALAPCCHCSVELLTTLYSNRRSIMQPTCDVCRKLVPLEDCPTFSRGVAVCGSCSAK